MNYFKYLFSDSKALIYWFVVFFFILIFTVISIFVNYGLRDPNSIIFSDFTNLIILVVCFIAFYSPGYLNIKRQEWFLNKYPHFTDKGSLQEMEVVLYLESYSVKPFRHNQDVEIKPTPVNDKFRVLIFRNIIGLFGQSYDLGVFKRPIKPILISLDTDVDVNNFRYAKVKKLANLKHIGSDLELTFESSIAGIKKIRIKNWKTKNES